MRPDLAALLPSTKMETHKAEALVSLGYPTVEPVLSTIMEWMQDMNWPVAQVFQPFLASIGKPLVPHVQKVLETKDEIWKHWVLQFVVAESNELMEFFMPELQRLATHPTANEHAEELDVLAQTILERVG